jgi:hypothetical protein
MMTDWKRIVTLGATFFVVRGVWDWKKFVQPDSSKLAENLGLLLVETLTFTFVFFAMDHWRRRRWQKRS